MVDYSTEASGLDPHDLVGRCRSCLHWSGSDDGTAGWSMLDGPERAVPYEPDFGCPRHEGRL